MVTQSSSSHPSSSSGSAAAGKSPDLQQTVIYATVFNVLSSVAIIVINKNIFSSYKFPFPTVMTLCHFLTTCAGLRLLKHLGFITVKDPPAGSPTVLLKWVAALYAVSIPLGNLSLLTNSVGFYQLAKIAVAPLCATAEYLLYKKRLNQLALIGLAATCIGIATATVEEIHANMLGTVIAFLSAASTVAYQLFTRQASQKLQLGGLDLVYHALPMSSVVLLLLCPLMDNVSALAMYPFSAPLVSGLLLSSIVALATNWSLFALLGALSPLTYNILGHIKTISILLIAFTFFHEDPTGKKIFGIIVALTGMITYSFA